MNAHGGALAVAAAQAFGVDTMFTLSGGHVFPLYDGAVKADPPMRIVDVRHEQTAVFAAEAYAKLTRKPGLAVVTAGPGVTNSVSAITTAYFNGTPLLVLGGRAPAARWGAGSLQELDHPPILAPVTKYAGTVGKTEDIARAVYDALVLAVSRPRGPVFLDIPMDVLFSFADAEIQHPTGVIGTQMMDGTEDGERLVREARRPVVVAGSDVWGDRAERELVAFAERLRIPVVMNGQGRGCLPADHELAFSRVRGRMLAEADVVIVAGTPLDFRLGFGDFGSAHVVHLFNGRTASHVPGVVTGRSAFGLRFLLAEGAWGKPGPQREEWIASLRADEDAKRVAECDLLDSDAVPIHPARVYGELRRRLARDAVVIGDGGDFVSWAGKLVESYTPGCWLDPGPYGCLGTGLGYAIGARLARPDSQVVLMLGDGAAGFSLMDVDTLVRHDLPVVIICGNNGIWGLEKHPMQFLYGYDVAADLQPECGYDDVVRALGGGGETVRSPGEIGPALDRALASGQPYLVNVLLDPAVAYPRSSVLA